MNGRKTDGTDDFSRPYEKCLRFGASALTDAELLAVIIRTGTREKDCLRLAEDVLKLSGGGEGLSFLARISIPELMTLSGIGEVKAIQFCCIGEISRRISSSDARSRVRANDPDSVADYYMERLRHDEQENIYCMMLDMKNHVIGEELVSRGTVSASLLSTRDLFLAAMRFRAVGIILVHNHPSGDPTPSRDDLELTDKVVRAGELLDIHLLDHIVIGDRCYVSLTESGFLNHGSVYV